jgi:AbrB family looped-hinge helix DNA binding protein
MKAVATSTITSKSQTVIPRLVRERLGLCPGDRLRYIETAKGIVIEKARVLGDDTFLAFTEWASEADEKAYANL